MPSARVAAFAVLLALAAVIVPAAQSDIRVRIASPTEDAYLSGPVRLIAVLEPASAAGQVTQVVFFADGQQVCAIVLPPFECEWDAGQRIAAHQIRVAVTLDGGRRIVQNVRTRQLAYTESVDVDVVQVAAVVTDNNGRFVRGLKQADFRIFDDGTAQAITHFATENVPLELVTAIDVSSSMRDALPKVRTAAKAFLAGLEPRDQVTLIGFNDNIFTLARRSTDQAARTRAIDRLAAWGGTALYDAIVHALDLLGRQPGRRSVVLFSDGDDQSSRTPIDTAVARTEASDATIYAIGQGRAVRSRDLQKLMERLSAVSGGRAFFPEGPQKLSGVFDEILQDIRNQYLIAYPPPGNMRNGAWHQIRVEVAGARKYNVRARQGYRLMPR
jgi:Ca-activated chloride channel homolog